MERNENKELIELLDDILFNFSVLDSITIHKKDKPKIVEIKQKLEQQAQPDEELVEKMLTIGMDCEREEQEKWPNILGVKEDAKAEIRKLLSQPEITRGEIEETDDDINPRVAPELKYIGGPTRRGGRGGR